MKKLLVLMIVLLSLVMLGLTSCGQRETTTYLYRVEFITSKAKTTVVDVEKGVEMYGSYRKGDTVHVTRGDSITTDGRYRKAVITQILGAK